MSAGQALLFMRYAGLRDNKDFRVKSPYEQRKNR